MVYQSRYRRAVQILNVTFGAFKSLYDVSCDLSDFTVITGPNGAGKSNLADGLNFISEAYRNGLEIAVARAGGYDSIAHRRSGRARAPISVSVTAAIDEADISRLLVTRSGRRRNVGGGILYDRPVFRHDFSFRAKGQALASEFQVEHDRMEISDSSGLLLSVERIDNQVSIEVGERLQRTKAEGPRNLFYPLLDPDVRRLVQDRQVNTTDLLITQLSLYGSIFNFCRRQMQGKVFQLSPQQARRPGVPTPNASLSRYGENLPAVVDYLRKHRAESWSRIEDAMRSVIPGLAEIETRHTEDRSLALRFREQGVRRAWSASEMSDGTIQALALFTAIFDGRSPFLLVEEPENSLHPWVLREFVELCRKEGSSQIILTTHSPVVMDYVSPDCLRLMWQRHGRSAYERWSSLAPSLVEAWKKGELRTFEAYDSGLLSQAVPPGHASVQEEF